MNKTQAKRELRKLFGDKAMWRYDERAPKAEEREAIAATLPGLRDAYETAKAARDARRAELLSDPEYVRLREAADAAYKAKSYAYSRANWFRVTIGIDRGIAFEVVAHGDNWQEAIEAARAKVRS